MWEACLRRRKEQNGSRKRMRDTLVAWNCGYYAAMLLTFKLASRLSAVESGATTDLA